MGVVNLLLLAAGLATIAVGWSRARGPWLRYQALKAEDANAERYSAWLGGIRDTGRTGASVAMEILRRQVQQAVAVIVVGFVLVFIGFAIH